LEDNIRAKEQERKIAPRLFAMVVLEMSVYYCVTEANIAKIFSHTSLNKP
jgi:hypothetical protein